MPVQTVRKGSQFLKKFLFLFLFTLEIFFETRLLASSSLQKGGDVAKKKLIKILAIDGGGIRGFIPALVLKNLEARLTNKKLAECFDIMAGTSAGGLIVLLLNMPDGVGKPKYTAARIVDLYSEFGKSVFHQSLWHRIKSFNGWFEAKYISDDLDTLLERYLGDAHLRDAVSNIIIPAYDLENDKTFFFKKIKAKKNLSLEFYLRDVGRATTAAPTYFKAAKIKNFVGDKYLFIDGSVSINNPAFSAYIYAHEMYGSDCDFLLVSLGTGTHYGSPQKIIQENSVVEKGGIWGWVKDNNIVSLLLHAGEDTIDYQLKKIFKYKDAEDKYFRLQVILDSSYSAIDDTSSGNIKALESYAQKLITKNHEVLDMIASLIER